MTQSPHSEPTEQEMPGDMTEAERQTVEHRKSPPARVVHEVIRQQGIDELERPSDSLFWSGIAAGVAIWLSLITQDRKSVV